MTLGEINYAAYRLSRNGKTFDGREAPTWEQLEFGIKEAWEEGARAVIAEYLNHPHGLTTGSMQTEVSENDMSPLMPGLLSTPAMPMLNLSHPDPDLSKADEDMSAYKSDEDTQSHG